MLIFNCTKTAADFFSTRKQGVKHSPLEAAPKKSITKSMVEDKDEWQWLVHATKVKGKSVLIVMEVETRFSMTLAGIKKGDHMAFIQSLEHHFIVHIHEMMKAVDTGAEAITASLERYAEKHSDRAFYQRGYNRLQMDINDVAGHFRRWVDAVGSTPSEADVIGQDVFVNQLPRKRNADDDAFIPQHKFLQAWLTRYGDFSADQAGACIATLVEQADVDFAEQYSEQPTSNEIEENPLALDATIKDSDNVVSLETRRDKDA